MSESIEVLEIPETNTAVPEVIGASKNKSKVKIISLKEAMNNKLRFQAKLLQQPITITFYLGVWKPVELVHKGLRVQPREVPLLESPTSSQTCARQNHIYRCSEHTIIKTLIEHYDNVQTESEKALQEVDKGIRQEL